MTAGIVASVALVAAVAAVVVFKTWWSRKLELEFLASDEQDHEQALDQQPAVSKPHLVIVPDGFTCLGCYEADALPDRVWCATCSERASNFPSEPIERGQR